MTSFDAARQDLEDAETHVARLRELAAKGEPVGNALATAEWWAEMVRKRVMRLAGPHRRGDLMDEPIPESEVSMSQGVDGPSVGGHP